MNDSIDQQTPPEMTDAEMDAVLDKATPEELAEMESVLTEYVAGVDAVIGDYETEVSAAMDEADAGLAELDSAADQIVLDAQQQVEGDALASARDALS